MHRSSTLLVCQRGGWVPFCESTVCQFYILLLSIILCTHLARNTDKLNCIEIISHVCNLMIYDLVHGYACFLTLKKSHSSWRNTHTDTLTEKPDLGLMVHISFSPEEKLHNLVMAFLTCNIQCCLAILYM